MIFFTGMKVLSDGIAALVNGVDVIRTAAKPISTSTKTLIAGIETLCININSIYNAMEATSAFLEAEVTDLLDLFTGVEVMSTAEIIRFIRKQCMSSDSDFELPLEMILHFRNISLNLKDMTMGYKTIQAGMKLTSLCNKDLPTIIDFVYENMQSVVALMQVLSEAEKITSVDKETIYDAFKVLCLAINAISNNLDLINRYKNAMYFGFKCVHEGMSIVNDFIQEELEDIKIVFEYLEYFLSQPAGMIIELNSR